LLPVGRGGGASPRRQVLLPARNLLKSAPPFDRSRGVRFASTAPCAGAI